MTHAAGADEQAIRELFGVPAEALLGAGGEARVFAVDDATVLRILHPSPGPPRESAELLLAWWNSLDHLAQDAGVALPLVLQAGRVGRQNWTLDRRIPGRSLLAHLRATPDVSDRRRALLSMLDAAGRLRQLPLPPSERGFRRLVQQPPRTFDSLAELLDDRIAVGLEAHGGELDRRVGDLAGRRSRLVRALATRNIEPAFVHNDYFPGNVLCDEHGMVTGVCDIGAHALAADPVMDQVACACMLNDHPGADDDRAWLSGVLRERLGADAWLVEAYTQFYALYYAMDAALLDWSERLLTGR